MPHFRLCDREVDSNEETVALDGKHECVWDIQFPKFLTIPCIIHNKHKYLDILYAPYITTANILSLAYRSYVNIIIYRSNNGRLLIAYNMQQSTALIDRQ